MPYRDSYHTRECAALIKWAHLQEPAMPELGMLIYIANDAKRSRFERSMVKRMGLRKGVWDYFLALPRTRHNPDTRITAAQVVHGLWIEMKSPDDRLSTEQEFWGEKVRREGYGTFVARSWVSASEVLTRYIKQQEEGRICLR